MNPSIYEMTPITKSLDTYCFNCKAEMEVSGLEEFSLHTCPSCESQIVIPKAFGNYHLIECLSEGAFYTTYKGYKIDDKYQLVVLKVFNTYSGLNQDNLMSFVSLLNQFSPADVVGFTNSLELKTINRVPVLIRPWIQQNAIQYLHEKRFSSQAACKIMYEILKILGDLESLRVFPIELKLSNILIDENSKVYIADTGIAQTLFTMGGSPQEYITSYFNLNNLHNKCLAEVKNHIDCTAFTCANLFYSLCSGGNKLYNATNIDELVQQRQHYQISIPFRLEGRIPSYLQQEVTSLFLFQEDGVTLKDKSLVFKRFIKESGPVPKRTKSTNRTHKQKLKKSTSKKTPILIPALLVFTSCALVMSAFLILHKAPEETRADSVVVKQNKFNNDYAKQLSLLQQTQLHISQTPESSVNSHKKRETANTEIAKQSAVLSQLPNISESEIKNADFPRNWQLSKGTVRASYYSLSGDVLSLKLEEGKLIKVHKNSLNNSDQAFLQSIQPRHWSISDNSFYKASFSKSDGTNVFFTDIKGEGLKIAFDDLSESDKILVNIVKFRTWTDKSNNILFASLIRIEDNIVYLKSPDLEIFAVKIEALSSESSKIVDSCLNKLDFIDKISKARQAFAFKEYSNSRSYYHEALAIYDFEEIFSILEKIQLHEANNIH